MTDEGKRILRQSRCYREWREAKHLELQTIAEGGNGMNPLATAMGRVVHYWWLQWKAAGGKVSHPPIWVLRERVKTAQAGVKRDVAERNRQRIAHEKAREAEKKPPDALL